MQGCKVTKFGFTFLVGSLGEIRGDFTKDTVREKVSEHRDQRIAFVRVGKSYLFAV
jgi:hypothetical protein